MTSAVLAGPAGWNWGGNIAFRAQRVERPASLDALAMLCAGGDRIAAVASRHSFSEIGDADVLVDLSLLASAPVVDSGAMTVAVSPSTTYGELAKVLDAAGHGLHNLASLPHISVGGAVATATHGSGSHHSNLASAVVDVEMVLADGSTRRFGRGDADFDGAVVGLGALGVVTRLTLAIEPTYDVEQRVFDGLEWNVLTDSFDALLAAATSVSVFTRWGADAQPGNTLVGEVWMKQRVDEPRGPVPEDFGLVAADTTRHPIPGADGASCTEQFGRPGPWWQRLTHFRVDEEPSSGAEIQSEVFVDRADSAAAIAAMRSIGAQLDDVLLVSEIRTVAADELWMSPHHQRTTTAFHFTWKLDPPAVQRAVDLVDATLRPFAPRPHLGKMIATGWHARDVIERRDDFLELKARLDPTGVFTTPWFARHIA